MVNTAEEFEDLAIWGDINPGSPSSNGEEEQSAWAVDPRPTPQSVIDLDAQVASLESQLKALTLQRAKLLAERALINVLPPELLSRIFELAVHPFPDSVYSLCQVSPLWRKRCLATPQVWSYIRLDHNWGYGRRDTFLAKAALHLSRACPSPTAASEPGAASERQRGTPVGVKLLIDIDFRYLDTTDDVAQIMDLLAPYLSRCYFFRASTPDWDWMRVVSVRANVGGLGASLEELFLRVDPCENAEDQTPVAFLSRRCERLHTLGLDCTALSAIRAVSIPGIEEETAVADPQPLVPVNGEVQQALPEGVEGPVGPPPATPPPEDEEGRAPSLDSEFESEPQILLPNLRNLLLMRSGLYPSSAPISVPLAGLLHFLAHLPSLMALTIISTTFLCDGSESIFHPHVHPVDVSTLERIRVCGVSDGDMSVLLGSLQLDGLKVLSARAEGSTDDGNLGWLARLSAEPSFISPSPNLQPRFPDMRQLDLRGINTDGPALPALIRALHTLPLLEALALNSNVPPNGLLGSKLFDLLSAPSPPSTASRPSSSSSPSHPQADISRWLLPRLRALIIQGYRDVSGHEVLRVARARTAATNVGVRKLEYVRLVQCYSLEYDSEVVETLKTCVETVVLC